MPAIPANTKLLLHEENANTDSSSSAHTITDGAAITYSTTTVKLGSYSASFDGSVNGFQSSADSADWAFGTGDFSMGCYVNFSALPGSGSFVVLMSQYDQNAGAPNNVKAWRFYLANNLGILNLKFQVSTDGTTLATTITSNNVAISTGTWYWVEIDRASGTYYFFLDGVQVGTGALADNIADVSQIMVVGASLNNDAKAFMITGFMDEIILTKGSAMHTSNFTPPSQQFGVVSSTNDTTTSFLLLGV